MIVQAQIKKKLLHNVLINVLWIKKKAGVAKQKDITYIIEQL